MYIKLSEMYLNAFPNRAFRIQYLIFFKNAFCIQNIFDHGLLNLIIKLAMVKLSLS